MYKITNMEADSDEGVDTEIGEDMDTAIDKVEKKLREL
jgi:hypothetical protein